MGQKLHRSNRSVFKRRNPIWRVLLTVTTALAIVTLGFFGTKLLWEAPQNSVAEPVTGQTAATQTTTTTAAPVTDNAASLDSLRAVYLPHNVLTDSTALTQALQQAKAAGFTAVLFDMKDTDGVLYFRASGDKAVQVNSFAENALEIDALRSTFTAIREAGLNPIPRLYTFCDNAAARVLEDARVYPTGNPSWVWYDNKPDAGGKAWLNPYADAAHLYLIDLAKELRDAGAAAVLFDGVQFPAQTSGAYFGDDAATKSRADALTSFVTAAKQLLGDTCPVILAHSADSALGNKTQTYGGNPLTFGATIAAPIISGNADEATIKQMATRIKVIETSDQPMLAPILPYTDAASAKQSIGVCADQQVTSYILYAADGRYDFDALT